MNDYLEIKDLKVYYNVKRGFLEEMLSKKPTQIKAVDGVSLSIKRGEIVSIVGESGSGKTTLGKAILGLAPRTGGEIFFEGKAISRYSSEELKKFRRKVQMIFQDPYQSLNPRDLVIDLIGEALEITGFAMTEKEKTDRIISAMEWAGLKPASDYLYRYPHELSGGQRQRAAIACALVLEPELIVADEPVSMLDVSIRADILKLMVEMRDKKGISYLFITHDLSLAWLISNRIAIMYLGKIVEIGTPEILINSCRHPYTKALVNIMPLPKAARGRKRNILKGEAPNPANIPTGCRFHTRCPEAFEKCRFEEPEPVKVDDYGHYAACHLIKKAEICREISE